MKSRLIFVTFGFAPLLASGQLTEPTILERGPHHRVVAHSRPTSDGSRDPAAAEQSYVELATGMHYWENGRWLESQEVIEASPQGATARRGPHKVAFAANLNSSWAIDFKTADGKRFRSHVLGLAYTDASTGKSVLIAEVKDSIGQIAGANQNQVLYQDAFTDFAGDVRYTYTRAGFEQDIILRQRPPSPEAYGLDPETTRLEVFTEFLEPPVPRRAPRVVRQETDPERRRTMVDPDFTDELLEFGETQIGSGRAFSLGNQGGVADQEVSVPVGKTWERIDGRDFLIEKVEYPGVKAQLDALPRAALSASDPVDRLKNLSAPRGMMARILPAAPRVAAAWAGPMRMASLPAKENPGFVMDYAASSMGGPSDALFRSDTTYYITGSLNLGGVTTLEGGTVIKFSKPSSPSAPLKITGANARLLCLAGPYRPVILTAKDDDSVGERISGSTGMPAGAYANCALSIDFDSSLVAADLANLRIRYAKVGLHFNGGNRHVVRHSQFLNCETALELTGAAAECHLGNS